MLIGLLVGYAAIDPFVQQQPTPPSMTQCVTDTLALFNQKNAPTPEVARDAREHCYSLIQAQGLLSDFAIRRLSFFQQYRANAVLMWMVVSVTLAGVVLAGLQLWASYRLAADNRSGSYSSSAELTLARDRLVLKSSITGLFILVISFCFFLVFVFYVYKIEPMADQNNSISSSVPKPTPGGLGAPLDDGRRPSPN
ncbi:hypothetical protein EAS56_17655 [Bradyrhizobium guangzhouense]|uniref:Uncharacterized protein n=1 Tax=Bradyrhizobium guangzhouense TaxID=1325095 RepID=A0ABY0E5D7_9BRAD|nr:hypothetical protein EAS56_17655 [Bradyrhizobium guangzhouense]